MALTKITSDVIAAGAVESTHIASGAISSSHLSSITTDNVSEGSTNTYFTNARARGSVSVTGGGLSYDSGTGVIQIGSIPNASLTNSSLTVNSNSVSLGGSVTLDTDDIGEGSTNLYFTNARAQGAISGGTGVTVSSGEISIGQDVATSSTPTFGNITTTGYIAGPATFTIDPAAVGDNTGTVVIAGNLQVDGTTTTINSTTMEVDDLNITLASGAANAAAADGAGITVDGASATITYDGTNDEWDFNKDINVAGNATITTAGSTVLLVEATGDNDSRVRVRSGTSNISYIEFADPDDADTGEIRYDHSTNSMQFRVNGNQEALTIDSNKNVGIGTSNPDNQSNYGGLTINGASGGILTFMDDDVKKASIQNAANDLYIQSGSQTIFRNGGFTSGDEAMRIDSSGNVGIGVTSPSSYTFGDVAISGGTSAGLTLVSGTTGIGTLAFADGTSGNTAYRGYVQYSHVTDNLTIGTGGTPVATIDSSGKLLIGDTASHVDDLLQIETPASGGGHGIHIRRNDSNSDQGIGRILFGNASDNDLAMMSATTDGSTTNARLGFFTQPNGGSLTERMTIKANGDVGIGETSPDTTLHLKSAGATSIAIESTTNAQNLDLLFYNNAGSTQGYIRYAEGAGDFYFVPQNGGGATLKLDWTGFMAYGDEPSGDPPPNTASFRMNNSSTTGGPSTGGSTGGNTYYPVVIGGGTHLAGRAFGIGLDPEGYGYRNKVGIVVEGDNAGYSKGDLHFLFNNSSDGQNAQISDAKFTFLREGYLGIGTRSPQRKLHIIGADGSSGMTEGNSRCALFIDNSAATYVNIASGNTSNGAIFFSDVNANNRGAVRYEHLTDSMSFDRGGSETLRLSGQTNVAYTADGLFHSNARPHTWQCTTGGSFVLGYRDHGSGLYQGAMGLQYDCIDGLGNTAYRDALVLKETSNGGQEHFRVRGNGNVTNTNNSYLGISDQRLKTDIVDASSQWEDIKAVRVRKFKFGTAPEGYDFLQIGVISQELEAAGMNGLIEESDPDDAQLAFNPELVGQQVKNVKYSVLYMKAIKALQEAMNRIEQLETRVTELEG